MAGGSTTFRHKGGGARISVNLDADALVALEFLHRRGPTEREAINAAILAAARDAWEEDQRQAREEAR